jgi:putative SOS response-associated peptidase YedK
MTEMTTDEDLIKKHFEEEWKVIKEEYQTQYNNNPDTLKEVFYQKYKQGFMMGVELSKKKN